MHSRNEAKVDSGPPLQCEDPIRLASIAVNTLKSNGRDGCGSKILTLPDRSLCLQRRTLEHLGRCRYDGCVRTELTKKLGSDANRFHYVIKVASTILCLP